MIYIEPMDIQCLWCTYLLIISREQLSVKEQQLKNKGIITAPSVQQQIAAGNTGSAILGAGRIAQLEAQLKQAKVRDKHRTGINVLGVGGFC